LKSQYGGNPQAWAMVLNTVDQLGNSYCHELAALGFDLILCGPQVDQDRMHGQGQIIQQKYSIKTHVLVVDYNKMAEF